MLANLSKLRLCADAGAGDSGRGGADRVRPMWRVTIPGVCACVYLSVCVYVCVCIIIESVLIGSGPCGELRYPVCARVRLCMCECVFGCVCVFVYVGVGVGAYVQHN